MCDVKKEDDQQRLQFLSLASFTSTVISHFLQHFSWVSQTISSRQTSKHEVILAGNPLSLDDGLSSDKNSHCCQESFTIQSTQQTFKHKHTS